MIAQGTCHYTDYDFMNQNSQLRDMYEYVGLHLGNSMNYLLLKEVELEGTTFHKFGIVSRLL